MVRTPWGGTGEKGARSKRARLLAAMVATCAERGYEATSVAHLLELSGVSRAGFYERFENKADCFEAMLSEAAERTLAEVERRAAEAAPGAPRVEAAIGAFGELIALQPATARACLLDAFAAGPTARATMELALNRLEAVVTAALAECEDEPAMPAELRRAAVAGIYKIFQNRAAHGRTEGLAELTPQLAAWLLDQQPPPQPLRPGRRGPGDGSPPPAFALHSPAERIMRALAANVAEHGYPDTTVAMVAARAQISQRTFYEHFLGKEEAMIAALDASGAQMLASTLPAIRRAPDWPSAVRSAYARMCAFMAAEPDFARLRAIDAYAAGAKALSERDRAGAELLEALLEAAPEPVTANAQPLVLETIAATVYALLYDFVNERDPRELPQIVPLAVYIALAPLIGPADACEAANGDGRLRGRS